MTTRILAALAAACIATPALASSAEPFGPPCALPSAVMLQITMPRACWMRSTPRTRRPTTALRRS